jgi:hypothetical protein
MYGQVTTISSRILVKHVIHFIAFGLVSTRWRSCLNLGVVRQRLPNRALGAIVDAHPMVMDTRQGYRRKGGHTPTYVLVCQPTGLSDT